jgi:hypothetical protein
METEIKKITEQQLKITEQQLEILSKQQKDLSDILINIGVLESQKHSYLHQLADTNKSIEDFKLELQEQYGSVNIDLQDGSYTEIEKA